ncbi:serpin family protein [Cellulomonas sp. DKR-3]|uniref:Serpin family protein n=1 Tax=Cellulomonas fulva TaxID=2835530 RepID=A0ABS5U0I2_9CELL|nr:serpin family protein [Cellulomonas fulva]MBT0994912.1 serpin family protein [Cellulomonas fulva]
MGHGRGTRRQQAWIGAAGVLLLAGCASSAAAEPGPRSGEGERQHVALDEADALDEVVAASWELGVAALRESDGQKAAVVSPSSLVSALAMVAEGARGDEALPFDATLGAAGDDRTDAVNALLGALERYEGDPAVVQEDDLPETPVLHSAQQVVVDDQTVPEQDYLDVLTQSYGAGVMVTDLATDQGLDPLGAWVREHTGGLVEDTAMSPDPLLALVLQDAVAFAGAFEQPFEEGMTADRPFAVGGTRVDVLTMSGTNPLVAVEQDGWTAVRLPFTDDLSLDVVLPPVGSPEAVRPADAPPEVLAALGDALDSAPQRAVQLSLPVLDLSTRTDLMPLLSDRGLTGWLSGLVAGDDDVAIGQGTQQAVLELSEGGVRAAAVTELGIVYASGPIVELEVAVDRPFLLSVRDGSSGWPVFLAAVEDPRP